MSGQSLEAAAGALEELGEAIEAAFAAVAAEADPVTALIAATLLGDGLRDLSEEAARLRLRQVNRLRAEWPTRSAGGFTDYLADVTGVHRSRAGQLSKAARRLAERERDG